MPCQGLRSFGVRRIAAAALVTSGALLSPAGATDIPPTKVQVSTFTCDQFDKLSSGEERDRILIYMNGYVDGTRRATSWDAAVVGKRVDEVVRICKENPKLTLLAVFKRVWGR